MLPRNLLRRRALDTQEPRSRPTLPRNLLRNRTLALDFLTIHSEIAFLDTQDSRSGPERPHNLIRNCALA